jgi:hypothetical protein
VYLITAELGASSEGHSKLERCRILHGRAAARLTAGGAVQSQARSGGARASRRSAALCAMLVTDVRLDLLRSHK